MFRFPYLKQPASKKGWLFIYILAGIGVVLWLITPKPVPIFSGFNQALASLGELAGILGMILFSLNLILSVRTHYLERQFQGLEGLYKAHNTLGQWAFILLLFHPIFLLFRYANNTSTAFRFLLLGESWPQNFGILALWTMLALVVLTLYIRPKYHIWKITHKIFGVALFLAGLHVYLIPGSVLQNPWLKGYILLLAFIGILVFFYRALFGKWLVKKYVYQVEKIEYLNKEVMEVTLTPLQAPLEFIAGQFIYISFQQKGLSRESHPFSISSKTGEKELMITIKVSGDFTQDLMAKLVLGTEATIEGPYGNFSYEKCYSKNQVWIAGGVGVTPFLSFLRSWKENSDYHVDIFYCVRNNEELLHPELFDEINTMTEMPRIHRYLSDMQGLINVEYMEKELPSLREKEIFLCAPPAMIRSLKTQLMALGIKEQNIHSEEFQF